MFKHLIFYLLLTGFAYSQKQISSLDVTIGATQDGFAGSIDYNSFFDRSRKSYIQAGILVTDSKFNYKSFEIDYNILTFSLNYFHQFYGNRSGAFKIYGGVGLTGGYEYVNNGKNELPNGALLSTKSNAVYGANVGIDSDIYLNDKFSFVIRLREYWHVYSDIGTLIPYGGLGIKYYIN